MPDSNTSPLDSYANIALGFTMVCGALSGLFWFIDSRASQSGGWQQTAATVFVVLTAIGGISMGLLYLARRSAASRGS